MKAPEMVIELVPSCERSVAPAASCLGANKLSGRRKDVRVHLAAMPFQFIRPSEGLAVKLTKESLPDRRRGIFAHNRPGAVIGETVSSGGPHVGGDAIVPRVV